MNLNRNLIDNVNLKQETVFIIGKLNIYSIEIQSGCICDEAIEVIVHCF